MRKRISIRASILTIFLTLFIITSALIITDNYMISQNMLLDTAKTLFKQSNDLIRSKVDSYLLPLANRADLSVNLIKNKTVDLSKHTEFNQFLYYLIKDYPYMVNAYFGDKNGNFYEIKRVGAQYMILRASRTNAAASTTVKTYLNSDGKITGEEKNLKTETADPRARPWYKSAVSQKRLVWTDIYLFQRFKGMPEAFGVTAAIPAYDDKGELMGVFGVDVTLDSLDNFIDTLEVSKHSTILILDSSGNIISSETTKDKLENISTFHMPWIKKAFLQYESDKTGTFFYNYNGRKYLISFNKFPGPKNMTYSAMVSAPVSDVLGGLQKGLLISVLFALAIVILNISIIILFSKRLSKPIIHLAKEAIKIKSLHLEAPKWEKTFIKEIFVMQRAFNSMNSALKSFSRYVPITLVKDLLDSGEVAHIGGKSEEITLLFSDITDFTSLSEPMAPKQLTAYLSEYFEEMTSAIHGCSGTLDKYIGDGIMAFWGAPKKDKKQAAHACRCAVIFLEKLQKLNEKWRKAGAPEVKIRIGLNTGKVVVGNVGSHDRLSYTAIGDAVNLASRLQNINKVYGAEIIVSDSTYQKAKDNFQFRLLDFVAVRGKKECGYIYQLLTTEIVPEELAAYNKQFREAFDAYASAKWDLAIQLFSQMKPLYEDDKLIDVYLERCANPQQKSAENWTGGWFFND